MQKQILFLGAPGVGKGTFAKRIAPLIDYQHLSAGDVLRNEVRNRTKNGLLASAYMNSGSLVPSSLIIDLMRTQVLQASQRPGVLLDGFPRQREQAELWAACNENKLPDLIVNILLNEEVLLTKLTSRRMCEKCGENFNLADIRFPPFDMPALLPRVPDVCDVCGASPLVQRPDDRPDVVRRRLALHAELEAPLLHFYKSRGATVVYFVVNRGVQLTAEHG